MVGKQIDLLLSDYQNFVLQTDRLPGRVVNPVLLGLYGEVGSIMTAAKKLHREQGIYAKYFEDTEEEFGDALWYFFILCLRLGKNAKELFCSQYLKAIQLNISGNDLSKDAFRKKYCPIPSQTVDNLLLALGIATSELFGIENNTNNHSVDKALHRFVGIYLESMSISHLRLRDVVQSNKEKIGSRFLPIDIKKLPNFDEEFEEEERIPLEFEIEITQRKSGQSYIQMNGVFIGDPLTDSIGDPDGYRFHDVFHFSHAAIMHWSPVFRGLLKRKRKSDKSIDRNEDGGRASVVEEGLSAWIFSQAKRLEYFANMNSLPFDLLKNVERFVDGYEVSKCPLSLWEKSILDGYGVFRKVRANGGGIVIGNRINRTITYRHAR